MNKGQRGLIEIYCKQLAESVAIVVNGVPGFVSAQDMKHYLQVAYSHKPSRQVPAPGDDRMIALQVSTKAMDVKEASKFISYLEWYARFRGVLLIDPREEHE